MDGLALLLCCQGEYSEAEVLHRKCVDLSQKKLGHNHEDTKTYIKNLEQCLAEKMKISNMILNIISYFAFYVVPALLAFLSYHFFKNKFAR